MTSKPKYELRLLSLPFLILALISCTIPGQGTKPPAPVVVSTGCEWTSPIYVSKVDVLTKETADAILSHNLTGAKICGWKPSSTPKEKAK